MMLTILLNIGVSQKVQTVVGLAFTIVPMACRIMLLTLGVAVLFSLSLVCPPLSQSLWYYLNRRT